MSHALGAETSCLTACSTHTEPQREARRRCLAVLQNKVKDRYTSLCDPFAGVGDDAAMLMVDPALTWVNDKDQACLALLVPRFPNATGHDLGVEPAKAFRQADLIYLDYNTYTLNKFHTGNRVFGSSQRKKIGFSYRDITDMAFLYASKFVILNDCTVHGLYTYPWNSKPCAEHILGKRFDTVEEFLGLLPGYYKQFYPAWDLTAVSRYRHNHGRGSGATAYLLFEKIA